MFLIITKFAIVSFSFTPWNIKLCFLRLISISFSTLADITFYLTSTLTSTFSIMDSHNFVRWQVTSVQVYSSCRSVEVNTFSAKLFECIGVVSNWMRYNKLQLNSDKTEVLWYTTGRRQHQLPTTALSIDGVQVSSVTSVRNLGIVIDSDLVMRTHVQLTVPSCFAALRQLHQIHDSVPMATFQSLVVTLVLSGDYPPWQTPTMTKGLGLGSGLG